MEKKKRGRKPSPGITFQITTRPEIHQRIEQIAGRSQLHMKRVAVMCVMAGIDHVDQKLREIHEPELTKAA